MSRQAFLLGVLFVPVVALAQANPSPQSESETRWAPTWTVSLTGGATSTFQLILGGMYGAGPDFQNKLTASVNNVFRNGDSVSMFGWSTTDLPASAHNWQAGLLYKTRLLHRKHHALTLTGGAQRWVLPIISIGAKDWLLTGNLTYGTAVKRVPVFVSVDSWSLLKSTLPTGSGIYTQIYTQHVLLHREGFQLALRQGPAHTYAWGIYGTQGNRIVRYGGSLVVTWKGATLEAGYRQQFALQDRIPNNRYWSFLLTRQITQSFR
jgi:hypothetical protein